MLIALLSVVLASGPTTGPTTGPPSLVWRLADDAPAGLEMVPGGVLRGIAPGRSELWRFGSSRASPQPTTTPCLATARSAALSPPLTRVRAGRSPWGPMHLLRGSVVRRPDGGLREGACTLGATLAGPLLVFSRGKVQRVIAHDRPVRALAVDGCRRGAALIADDRVMVFDLEGDAPPTTFGLDSTPVALELVLNGQRLAAIDGGGGIELRTVQGDPAGSTVAAGPIACTASGGELMAVETTDGATATLRLTDSRWTWKRADRQAELPVAAVERLSADGTGRWITATADGRPWLWDLESGRPMAVPGGDAIDVELDADGERLAVRRTDGAVDVFEVGPRLQKKGRLSLGAPPDDRRGATIAFTSDGDIAALAGDELGVWRLGEPDPMWTESLGGPGRALASTGNTIGVLVGERWQRHATFDGRIDGEPRPVDRVRLAEVRMVQAGCGGAVALLADGWHPIDALYAGNTPLRPVPRWVRPRDARAVDPSPSVCSAGGAARVQLRAGGLAVWPEGDSGPAVTAPIPRTQQVLVDDEGRVTALVDGAIMRWRPGGGVDRAVIVAVERSDYAIEVGGLVSATTRARRALRWSAGGRLVALESAGPSVFDPSAFAVALAALSGADARDGDGEEEAADESP